LRALPRLPRDVSDDESLAADAGRVEMPEEMKARLREFLLRQLRAER
jgi:hypothetical protein